MIRHINTLYVCSMPEYRDSTSTMSKVLRFTSSRSPPSPQSSSFPLLESHHQRDSNEPFQTCILPCLSAKASCTAPTDQAAESAKPVQSSLPDHGSQSSRASYDDDACTV
mmetsp:Transcript_27869/g.61099  ORF Transcript_27869/g.61099 Transcript_27869/m.61099 type:complete len:110 (+) Transcript_27869:1-330(+)